MTSRRKSSLALACASVFALSGCGDDDASPTQSKADLLVGTWYLESTEGDSDLAVLVNVSYTFEPGGGVRQRVGGEFLRVLRETEAVQQALEGEDLGNADRIDGANLNWIGEWTLSGDSLHVAFDLLIVEVFGDVLIIGKVTLPVFEQALNPAAQTELDYTCELAEGILSLRGRAVAIGVGAGSGQLTEQVEGTAGELAQQAVDLLATHLEGQDTQRYAKR